MVRVVLRAVRVDVGSATPILLLEEEGGNRVLPIFVGSPEATAIAFALQHVETPRPMTHDLLVDVISALGARIGAVEVTDLVDNTFYANLRLLTSDGDVVVSSRPSDAIAVAVRVGAPIMVSDDLMAREGQEIDLSESEDETDEETEARLVEQLREFLDTVRPEDFEA